MRLCVDPGQSSVLVRKGDEPAVTVLPGGELDVGEGETVLTITLAPAAEEETTKSE